MHSQSSRHCGVECGRVMCMTKKWVFGYCNFLRLNRTTRTLAYMVVIIRTTYTSYWCMRHPRSVLCSREDWQIRKVKILLAAVVQSTNFCRRHLMLSAHVINSINNISQRVQPHSNTGSIGRANMDRWALSESIWKQSKDWEISSQALDAISTRHK